MTVQRTTQHGRQVRFDLPSSAREFHVHGWQSWSETRWRAVDEPVLPIRHAAHRAMHADPVHATDPRPGGSGLGAARLDSGEVVALVCLGLGGWVSIDGDELVGTTEADEGEWMVLVGDELEVFDAIAGALGDTLGRRSGRRPRAWCSWYSMYTEIDEPALQAVLADLGDLPFDVFQVDDGWQRGIGDWQVRPDRFPDGLGPLVDAVHATDRDAGLWLAPFMVHETSDTACEHPEWLLRDAAGDVVSAGHNWGGAVFGLDLSRPDVLDHVRDTIGTVVGWGFDYLKLDFLYAGALPGLRHRRVHREQAYRDGIEAIREAAGDDAYLLACGAPLVASLGVFDGARIGPDVAEHWEHADATRHTRTIGGPNTRWAISTSVNRLWMQPLWDCDPDVAYFRDRRCMLTDDQKRLLQDLATIAGFRVTSDPPAWLSDDERDALGAWLRATPDVVRVGALTWEVDGRRVDFTTVATTPPGYDPVRP